MKYLVSLVLVGGLLLVLAQLHARSRRTVREGRHRPEVVAARIAAEEATEIGDDTTRPVTVRFWPAEAELIRPIVVDDYADLPSRGGA
jgi:hypothetical protein